MKAEDGETLKGGRLTGAKQKSTSRKAKAKIIRAAARSVAETIFLAILVKTTVTR